MDRRRFPLDPLCGDILNRSGSMLLLLDLRSFLAGSVAFPDLFRARFLLLFAEGGCSEKGVSSSGECTVPLALSFPSVEFWARSRRLRLCDLVTLPTVSPSSEHAISADGVEAFSCVVCEADGTDCSGLCCSSLLAFALATSFSSIA